MSYKPRFDKHDVPGDNNYYNIIQVYIANNNNIIISIQYNITENNISISDLRYVFQTIVNITTNCYNVNILAYSVMHGVHASQKG